MTAAGQRTTVATVLGHTQVRKLWTATLGGSLAVWIAQIALIVGVLQHHAGSALAWVLLASTVPALLAGIAGGTIVDRHDPRWVAQVAGTAGVGLLVATGFGLSSSLVLGTITYALYLVAGQLTAPARVRLLYAALPPDQRTAGNAALGTVSGIITVVGAAIGGVGVSTLGVVPCFALAAIAQAVAGGALWMLAPSRPPATAATQPGLQRSLLEGVTALRQYPLATSIILVGIAWGLIGGGYDVLIGLYGTHLLQGGGGAGVGLLYVADGLGVLAGSALAARLPAGHQGTWYALAYGLQGCMWAVFALGHNLLHAVLALLLMRVASGVIIAVDTTLLLASVPDRLYGRIFAVHTTTYQGVMRVSLAITGALLLAVSPRIVTLGAGVASVAVGIVWWLAVGRIRDPVDAHC